MINIPGFVLYPDLNLFLFAGLGIVTDSLRASIYVIATSFSSGYFFQNFVLF